MSYNDDANMHDSNSLRRRMIACAAQEGKGTGSTVEQWVQDNAWTIVSNPGWDAAWASAVAAGDQDPGKNEGVITDGMILSAIQPLP